MIYLKRDEWNDHLTNKLRLTHRLRAFHFWWIMGIIHIDNKGEDKGATLVHAWMKDMSEGKVHNEHESHATCLHQE
jgi:hypothetical protein